MIPTKLPFFIYIMTLMKCFLIPTLTRIKRGDAMFFNTSDNSFSNYCATSNAVSEGVQLSRSIVNPLTIIYLQKPKYRQEVR